MRTMRYFKAYDQYGRELRVEPEEWRSKVLPLLIRKEWDDPAALYGTVAMAVEQGFLEESLPGAERLLVIHHDSERSHTLLAHVRMELGSPEEAKCILEDCLRIHGRSALVLTRYARVLAKGGEQKKALETLWDALRVDPNEKEALEWWGAIHKARGGEKEFLRAMEAMALKGSWRGRLHLARHSLMSQQFQAALAHYEEALKTGGARRDLLGAVAGDLSAAGRHKELLDIIMPVYDPQRHGSEVGFDLLEAYLETKRAKQGKGLLKKMFLLNRPDLENKLLEYSDRFEGPVGVKKDSPRTGRKALKIIRTPVWFTGLGDPSWLLPESGGTRILFAPPTLKSGDTDGEAALWCRGTPLFLAERILSRSSARVCSVVSGTGGEEIGAARVKKLAKACRWGCDFVVAGSLDGAPEGWSLRLEVWDARKGVKTGIRISPGQESFALELSSGADWLIEHFSGGEDFHARKNDCLFEPPSPELAERYLGALLRVLDLSLIKGKGPKSRPKGERHIYNGLLDLCARMERGQAPKLLFLAAMAAAKERGSEVFDEFKAKALTLIDEEKDEHSPFFKLSPLLYRVFSMSDEFERRMRTVGRGADKEFRAWLDRF